MSKKIQKGGGSARRRNTVETPPVTTPGKSKKDSPLAGYQWQPGESGNPAGRPKTSDLKAEVRSFADEADPKIRKTRLRVWLEMADRRARQGSPKHLELLLAYGWGRPTTPLEHSGKLDLGDIVEKARRRAQADLPAPTNGHSDAQTAKLAAAMPDQDVSAAPADAEQPAEPAKPKIVVEPWAN